MSAPLLVVDHGLCGARMGKTSLDCLAHTILPDKKSALPFTRSSAGVVDHLEAELAPSKKSNPTRGNRAGLGKSVYQYKLA